MSTPKKGGKPIKITLTEGQITDIISQSARTRRGLKAESLEDRIAPSVIGAPLDPALVPGDGDVSGGDYGAPPPPLDPNQVPIQPFDPNAPVGDFVGGSDGSDFVTPPLPGDANFVQPPLDPLQPFDPLHPLGGVDPAVPPPLPFDPLHPIVGQPGSFGGAPGGFDGGEIPYVGPEGTVPYGPGQQRAFQRYQEHQGDDITTDPRLHHRADGKLGDDLQHNADAGGATPTPEELEMHRRNILRQLRGAGEGGTPPAPPVDG
jgi:hypothetical protein